MTDIPEQFEPSAPIPKPKRPRSVMWKVLMIVALILGLLIPLGMISGVIVERQGRQQEVIDEIAATWAPAQTLTGPILAVPYKIIRETTGDKGQKLQHTSKSTAYILPQKYQVQSKLKPETRQRGIYQTIVYTTDLTAEGSFDPKTIAALNIPKENILWDEAFLVIGIPHVKGLSDTPILHWQGKPRELLSGVNGAHFLSTGLYTPTALKADAGIIPFKLNLSLRGSRSFAIVPIGKQNTLQMTSTWASPSFIGNTLPTQRSVSEKGFTATWEIPYFSRNYGQVFSSETFNRPEMLEESRIGAELLLPVDSYRQSERATKYGILFLVLTFSTFFLFEMICRHRLHPFQYLLVGCALCLFYLMLLAVSEVTPFGWAYAIASVAIISAITLYSKAILGKVRKNAQLLIGGLLSVLYGYLYILLQMEDLSLLFGTIGLFIVLSVIMYVTRNIDWFNEQVS